MLTGAASASRIQHADATRRNYFFSRNAIRIRLYAHTIDKSSAERQRPDEVFFFPTVIPFRTFSRCSSNLRDRNLSSRTTNIGQWSRTALCPFPLDFFLNQAIRITTPGSFVTSFASEQIVWNSEFSVLVSRSAAPRFLSTDGINYALCLSHI